MNPAYTSLRGEETLRKRADIFAGIMKNCVLCPHRCRVDRTAGERGFCHLGNRPMIDSALAHHGEEPVLSGQCGAGTVFFSSCNMRCIYCQNYQISHQQTGETLDPADLSRIMTDLQNRGCHNIDAVTPTPHLSGLIEALLDASHKGLSIPLVYNCGGYENREIIELLDGIADIYLPDFKYGNDRDAYEFSGVDDYVLHATS
ncbi:MAG: radical SAM protein, partial [Syntrophobacterales bacterium]